MRVYFEIAGATQVQIHHGMLRKQDEHVIEERKAGRDRSPACAVEAQPDPDAGFFGDAPNGRLPLYHAQH
jgi:hypothetical protein